MSWMEITDLVERARDGCRSAYGELTERFRPTVYSIALGRLRNPAEAEELTQEVFLHMLRKLGQLRDPRCFAGWLRRMTQRMAINRLSRRGPVQGVEPEVLEQAQDAGRGPLDVLIGDEQKRELYRGLERLKPLDRATLVAFYLKGRSIEEMANEFETPTGTIKRRLHVARHRLKEQLV
jgi:RNA polymerase sigma-70 factor (ECF subfamily)